MQKQIEDLLKQYRSYHLKKYRFILEELFSHFENLDALKNKSVLELGPGEKINLFRFFKEASGVKTILAVGRMPAGFWNARKYAAHSELKNQFILPFLKSQRKNSFDIIYSRHVLEKNSINPLALLKSKSYWRHIKENRMQNPGKDLPASEANIKAIFKEAYRALKPGGIIITQIAKAKNNVLDDDFLSAYRVKTINIRKLGRLSMIITLVK